VREPLFDPAGERVRTASPPVDSFR
jgi:hypothetical protein